MQDFVFIAFISVIIHITVLFIGDKVLCSKVIMSFVTHPRERDCNQEVTFLWRNTLCSEHASLAIGDFYSLCGHIGPTQGPESLPKVS